jgi:hypothetical protein
MTTQLKPHRYWRTVMCAPTKIATRVESAAKAFAVAIPMMLMAGLSAPAQAPRGDHPTDQALTGTMMALQDVGQVSGNAAAQPCAMWRKDATIQGSIESCRETTLDEQPKPAYPDRLTTAAIASAKDSRSDLPAQIVDRGPENRDLAVKQAVRKGTARAVETRQARTYSMWLRQIEAMVRD